MLNLFVVGGQKNLCSTLLYSSYLWPSLLARMAHEVSRTEELAERRRAHSVDRAELEVGENLAWYVPVA